MSKYNIGELIWVRTPFIDGPNYELGLIQDLFYDKNKIIGFQIILITDKLELTYFNKFVMSFPKMQQITKLLYL